MSPPIQGDGDTGPSEVPTSALEALEAIRSHDFHPVDEDSFTVDHGLGRHGIADLDSRDWWVRVRGIRDLVRGGEAALPALNEGLRDGDVQVRYAAASALGILGAGQAREALDEVIREDADALSRSAAAMALGQVAATESAGLLEEAARGDASRDVRHQARLALDRIGKGMGATPELREAWRALDPSGFTRLAPGDPAPPFQLPDTDGRAWRLEDLQGEGRWVVLIWVFADWCPVCHREFAELLDLRERAVERGVAVATVECHDLYRCRVMVGKELEPDYWFADESFQEAYRSRIWWPHLVDRAGSVGISYGVDPMAYAVHAEYINRPATVIVDPQGIVRLAYYGTFWGDRPSVEETLGMIESGSFDYEHPERLRPASRGGGEGSADGRGVRSR